MCASFFLSIWPTRTEPKKKQKKNVNEIPTENLVIRMAFFYFVTIQQQSHTYIVSTYSFSLSTTRTLLIEPTGFPLPLLFPYDSNVGSVFLFLSFNFIVESGFCLNEICFVICFQQRAQCCRWWNSTQILLISNKLLYLSLNWNWLTLM